MRPGRPHPGAVALVLLLLSLMACDTPADPIALGQICLPERAGCASTVSLERSGVGRNALEIEASTALDSSASMTLTITTPDDIGLPAGTPRTDDRWLLAERTYTLGPGERVVERLEPFELTVAPTLVFELSADDATSEATLNYLLISEPLECIDDNDCARRETCEPVYGRCASCLSDGDCLPTQTCSRQSGRCFPEGQTGCSAAPLSNKPGANTPGAGGPAALILLMTLVVFARRRRRLARGATLLTVAVLTLCAGMFGEPGEAHAAPGASLSFGVGPRLLVGDFAQGASPGWGVALNQEFRWRFAGLSLNFVSGAHATRNDSPPFEARAQTFALAIGPRGYYPIGPVEAQVGIDYMRLGLAGTGLVQNTGLERDFHAVGGVAGARWSLGDFHLIGRATYHHLVDASGGLLGIDLMVGMGF